MDAKEWSNSVTDSGGSNTVSSQTPRKTKKTWTAKEDKKLTKLVSTHLAKKQPILWSHLSQQMLSDRTGKQCRERWQNHLRPDLKKGNWTEEEDRIIDTLQKKVGNQWSKISEKLPGRTDNDVKNRWHSSMRTLKRKASQSVFGGANGVNYIIKVAGEDQRECGPSSAKVPKNVIRKAHHTPVKSPSFALGTTMNDEATIKSANKFSPLPFKKRDHSLYLGQNHDKGSWQPNDRIMPYPSIASCSSYYGSYYGSSYGSSYGTIHGSSYATPVVGKKQKGSVNASDIFSPTFVNRQLQSSKKDITPLSSISVANLPPCNSGPTMWTPPPQPISQNQVKLVAKKGPTSDTQKKEAKEDKDEDKENCNGPKMYAV